MEAIALQSVTQEPGARPAGPKNGSSQAPPGAFSSLVEGIMAAEEDEGLVPSEDATPDFKGAQKADGEADGGSPPRASEGASGLGVSVAQAILDAKSSGASEPSAEPAVTDSLGKEVAPGCVEGTPKPASEEFAEAVARLVTEGPNGNKPQAEASGDVFPRPEEGDVTDTRTQILDEGPPAGPAAADAQGQEVAPGRAEGTPKPASDEFAEAVARLVTEGPNGDKPQAENSSDILPRVASSEFTSALAQLLADGPPKGEPPGVTSDGSPAGPAAAAAEASQGREDVPAPKGGDPEKGSAQNLVPGDRVEGASAAEALEHAPEEAEAKALAAIEAGRARGGEKSDAASARGATDQPHEADPKKGVDGAGTHPRGPWHVTSEAGSPQGSKPDPAAAGVSSPADSDSTQAPYNAAAAQQVPKESTLVEAASAAVADEAGESELEPVEPLREGTAPGPDGRSAQGLDVARAASEPHPTASTQEASAASRPAAPPVVERIVGKVVEAVQAGGGQERHEVSIQLNPPSLGRVHLTLLVEDSKIHVALYTTTNEARDLVEANVSHLRTALNHQGLALEQFSVEVRSGLAHHMAEQDWSGWFESFGAGSFFKAPGAASRDTVGPLHYGRPDGLSQIDLFI